MPPRHSEGGESQKWIILTAHIVLPAPIYQKSKMNLKKIGRRKSETPICHPRNGKRDRGSHGGELPIRVQSQGVRKTAGRVRNK